MTGALTRPGSIPAGGRGAVGTLCGASRGATWRDDGWVLGCDRESRVVVRAPTSFTWQCTRPLTSHASASSHAGALRSTAPVCTPRAPLATRQRRLWPRARSSQVPQLATTVPVAIPGVGAKMPYAIPSHRQVRLSLVGQPVCNGEINAQFRERSYTASALPDSRARRSAITVAEPRVRTAVAAPARAGAAAQEACHRSISAPGSASTLFQPLAV